MTLGNQEVHSLNYKIISLAFCSNSKLGQKARNVVPSLISLIRMSKPSGFQNIIVFNKNFTSIYLLMQSVAPFAGLT